jgi:hypothetical protein
VREQDDLWGDAGTPTNGRELVGRLWESGRKAASEKHQVVAAVRRAKANRTRDELRSDFEAELARRGMRQDPVWVERELDELHQSPSSRLRLNARNLLLVGSTLGRMARDRGFPEPPDWMQPPWEASYHGPPRRGDKVPALIDPAATERLDRAISAAPGHIGNIAAQVPVWFDREGLEGKGVGVYLGAIRVGELDSSRAEMFAPVMNAAERRGAKPRGMAQLSRAKHFTPPYLLVVEMP